jgi:hypothetical protein
LSAVINEVAECLVFGPFLCHNNEAVMPLGPVVAATDITSSPALSISSSFFSSVETPAGEDSWTLYEEEAMVLKALI